MKKVIALIIGLSISLASIFAQEVFSISEREFYTLTTEYYDQFQRIFGYDSGTKDPIIVEIIDNEIDGEILKNCLDRYYYRPLILDLSQVHTSRNKLNFWDARFVKEVIFAEDADIKYSFYRCNSLEKVTIPAASTTISDGAFYETINLREVVIPENSCLSEIGVSVFYGCENLESINLPKTLTTIKKEAFKNCKNLKTINISSCTVIEDSAFDGCVSLKDVDLTHVEELGFAAFAGCDSFESVVLGDKVEQLSYTFSHCKNLKQVKFGKSVSRIYSPFASCENLKKIILPKNSRFIIEKNILMDASKRTIYFVLAGAKMPEYRIPDTVDEIARYAFSGNFDIKKITNVNYAGHSAFANCKSVEEIEINPAVDAIEESCFMNCVNLKTVVFPDNLMELGDHAFMGCEKLDNVKMSRMNPFFNPHLYLIFYGCTSLSNIELPSNLKTIGISMFGKTALESIVIPETVEQIDYNAFERCEHLKEVYYNGTVEQLLKIRVRDWKDVFDDNITQITCSDGIFEFPKPELEREEYFRDKHEVDYNDER